MEDESYKFESSDEYQSSADDWYSAYDEEDMYADGSFLDDDEAYYSDED